MSHLTFHTENGKRVAEVASLLAEMGKKTVSPRGLEVKRLKNRHGLAYEDVFEAPPAGPRKSRPSSVGRHEACACQDVVGWMTGFSPAREPSIAIPNHSVSASLLSRLLLLLLLTSPLPFPSPAHRLSRIL